MIEKRRAMPDKVTVEMRVEDLPESLRALLPEHIPGMPYRVTLEPVEDREAKLAALRQDIEDGIRASEEGRTRELDGEELIAKLHSRHRARKT